MLTFSDAPSWVSVFSLGLLASKHYKRYLIFLSVGKTVAAFCRKILQQYCKKMFAFFWPPFYRMLHDVRTCCVEFDKTRRNILSQILEFRSFSDLPATLQCCRQVVKRSQPVGYAHETDITWIKDGNVCRDWGHLPGWQHMEDDEIGTVWPV